MKLTSVVINKYKSFLTEQNVKIEEGITRIVGKNESGKTAFLEALAKFNYFEEDCDFVFNEIFDFPKNDWKKFQKSEEDMEVVKCTFTLSEKLLEEIKNDVGEGVFNQKEISYGVKYRGGMAWYGVSTNEKLFIKNWLKKYELDKEVKNSLLGASSLNQLIEICKENPEDISIILKDLQEKIINKAYKWEDLVGGYIAKNYLKPNIPKFWYFDEYHTISSKININKMKNGQIDQEFTKEEMNTAKALFELANINTEELLNAAQFESFISELEATSNEITDEFFEYWSTNKNLEIKFEIEPLIQKNGNTIIRDEKILNIRIRNTKHRVSLPLKNRSKGFIWFFSFLVWFSKIQNTKNESYILLLDEPGLNLHASAQKDLLRFIEERLATEYQIIYTTHSPFMIDPSKLHEIRTVYDSMDAKKGSVISDAIQEKDPDTLFPLQAALGYDIAQNLYISKNNLLVEGPSDLIYITAISGILESLGRTSLDSNITIVPVGGLDKVTTFISLLRGSKLNVVCLLDSFTDQKGKKKVEDLIMYKIIKEKNIRFFDEFAEIYGDYADLEDLFTKDEYLILFNKAFDEYPDIKIEELDENISQVILQINKVIGKSRFNHYRPANKLAQRGIDKTFFSKNTLDRFEKLFMAINRLF